MMTEFPFWVNYSFKGEVGLRGKVCLVRLRLDWKATQGWVFVVRWGEGKRKESERSRLVWECVCVGMLRLESALMFPSGFENQGALSPLGDRLRAKPGPPNLANHPSFSRPLSFVFLLRHSLQNNLLFMLSLSLILYFFAGTLSFSFLCHIVGFFSSLSPSCPPRLLFFFLFTPQL